VKISSSQYQSVIKYFKNKPLTAFNAGDRLAFQGIARQDYELGAMDEATLRKLIRMLPTSILHPNCRSVRSKAKQTLLYTARPHLDPEEWPKIFRHINNNDRAGLRDFGGGQLGVLHDKAMATSLKGTIVWNERKFGDLIIMGPWTEIAAAIGAAGSRLSLEFGYEDMYAGDVNIEFARMYTEEEIPEDDRGFYVTHIAGGAFEVTDEEGHVELDPRGELVELGGGAVAGFAGAGTNFSGVVEAIDATVSTLDTAISMGENLGIKLKPGKGNRDMHTFVVSILPAKEHSCESTGVQSLSGDDLLQICKRLASIR
jgi:hypothetical protein